MHFDTKNYLKNNRDHTLTNSLLKISIRSHHICLHFSNKETETRGGN
jgi:hypothetical protein